MTIKIGTKIRALRKKNDITQEKLSEYLGVSAQAVSRWESGICYPDIEILPTISDFFNTSIDELLGINQEQKDNQVNKYIEKAEKEQQNGNFKSAIGIYREAVSRFPSSKKLQINLACAIGCIDNGKKISINLANEVINICYRILEDCVDDVIRYRALSILCWIYYRQLGDFDKAMEIVTKLPKVNECQEFVMAEILKIQMPSEKANEFIFDFINAMLVIFDKQEFAYSDNKSVMLEVLIGELNKLL